MRRDVTSFVSGIRPFYKTDFGAAYCGDSLKLLGKLRTESINLIVTSPPFALRRKKTYDNVEADEYVNWFMPFAHEFYRVLLSDGSLVIHIGGSWVRDKPLKSIYLFELLVELVKNGNFYLAQDLYWFNKAKLPTPAQWVTIKRCRLKDAVDHIWWLSKTPFPKADNRRVLKEYSESMKELLENPNYYKPNVKRPSEHTISAGFYKDNKGAIPANFLDFSNTDSRNKYLEMCKEHGLRPHPARFPLELPAFFIRFLTEPADIVLDPFGGSNTTGEAAEKFGRKWIAFEIKPEYLESSKLRFCSQLNLGVGKKSAKKRKK
jgi:site-specific DNA-methyltransferase (cytosine-N4-specific)